jgi:hypothetical protein
MDEFTRFNYIYLPDIWDPRFLEHFTMKKAIRFCEENIEPILDRGVSWLMFILEDSNDEGMYEYDIEDPKWAPFKTDTSQDMCYYCALNNCDLYAYFMAVYLNLRYPDKNIKLLYLC